MATSASERPTAGAGAPATRIGEPIVVGAGPGGLAAVRALKQIGRDPLVLEQTDRVCSTWTKHYEGLHLNSPRRMSSLPGMPMERRLGTWVARDDFRDYVGRYARWVDPRVEFGVEVTRITREDGGWRLETSKGPMWSAHVVVATGLNKRPYMPDWPGRDTFEGELIHAADYRNPEQVGTRDVLVVGVGATGTDVVMELARSSRCRLRLSVRTPPLIFNRYFSTAVLTQSVKHAPLPGSLVDLSSVTIHRLLWGDLSDVGLGNPAEGLHTRLRERGHGATIDRGLVSAVRSGRIEVVPAVELFEGRDVVLAGGARVQPEVVIAATGQRPGLEELVGHLGVLTPSGRPYHHGGDEDENAPGLYFLGYRIPPGQLPDMGIDSSSIARSVARGSSPNGGSTGRGSEIARRLSLRRDRPEVARPRYKPSATADANCAERAAEAHFPPDLRLFHDPYAKYFIQSPALRALTTWGPLARFTLRTFDRVFPGLQAEIVLRYHLYERELAKALEQGIDQVVLLGAGYDSTSLRLDLGSARLFEVDAPPTQQAKRRALAKHGLTPRNDVTFVPCDFEVQTASTRLAESGFDPARRSFVLWYGVLFYLSEEAVRGTLADIAKLTAAGSIVLWDYIDRTVVDGTTQYPGAQRARRAVLRRGEPYTFGLDKASAAALAEEFGFSVHENLRVTDLCERYAPPGGVWCSDDDYFGMVATERKA